MELLREDRDPLHPLHSPERGSRSGVRWVRTDRRRRVDATSTHSMNESSSMSVRSDRRLAGLISTREAAGLLGIGRGKIQYAQRNGTIPRPRRSWGDTESRYYREQDLPKLAEALGGELPVPDVPAEFAELFSGEGLFRAALQPGGWRSVLAVDMCRKKAAGYAARWGDRTHIADVRDSIEVAERLAKAGRIGLLTAGFPCTDASAAGIGRGVAGPGTSAVFGLRDVLRRLVRRPPDRSAGKRNGTHNSAERRGLPGTASPLRRTRLRDRRIRSVCRTLPPAEPSPAVHRLRRPKFAARRPSLQPPTGDVPTDLPSEGGGNLRTGERVAELGTSRAAAAVGRVAGSDRPLGRSRVVERAESR